MRSLLVLFVTVVFGVAAARADTLSATLGQPLSEQSHEVAISVENGVATYRVQRVFINRGEVADEASLDIDLPFGGGVTGLRIRARDTWYDGDLMEASAAAKLYEKLTGFGPFPAKDPALMQWVWPDKVHLQVFPVLPGGTSTVEYTLTVATSYLNGQYHLSYPRFAGPGLAAPAFTVRSDQPVLFDGQVTAPNHRFALPTPKVETWDGGVERAPGASYVFSPLAIPDVERTRGAIRAASIDLDLSHTYRGDLRVELVTPQGRSVVIHDRAGGSENDVRGRFPLALPPGTTPAGRWRLVISDHAARDAGTLNRWTLNFDLGRAEPVTASAVGPLFIPDAPEGADDRGLVTIGVAAPPIDTLAARLGRVVASPAHGFARLELDTAAELRPLPKSAKVVFVVDASYTEGEAGIAAQLAVARAYLRHVPDASFAIVPFRRFAQPLSRDFVAAQQFDRVVAAAALQPGNGSALDLGLASALELLRGRPGEKRVVVLSDAELRSSFAVDRVTAALATLPRDVIVHVVLSDRPSGDEVTERRDDDHPLAPIAAAGHGILLHLDGAGAADPIRLGPAVLGLVRPIRIDHFAVVGARLEAPETLKEGQSVRAMVPLVHPPVRVALEGKIWAEPFQRTVEVTEPFSKAAAAFVFAEHLYTPLDEREQMAVAMTGQVVSPVTSYIAIEPGTRPSRIGLIGRGSGGGSGSGYGRGGGGLAGHRIAPIRPDLKALLQPGVDRCLAQQTRPTSISLEIETTYDEIVDVIPRERGPLADCVVEAAWALRLPPATLEFPRDRYPLTFTR